jgi:hypothetical protein
VVSLTQQAKRSVSPKSKVKEVSQVSPMVDTTKDPLGFLPHKIASQPGAICPQATAMCHTIDLQISVATARCTEWMLCMAPTAELGSCHRHLLDFDVIVVILEKTYVLAEINPDYCLHGERTKIQ